MSRKIYLSVDFDYFCHEEDWWDWGHGETPLFQDLAWHTRVRMYEETLFEKFANPLPSKFWEKLVELGYNFDTCESIKVSDSHLFAAHDFLDLTPGRVEIVNFDAHHDMGYADWKTLKKQWIDKSRVDCSNWLLVLMHQLDFLTAACVYPEWKGTREVSKDRKPSWENTKSLRERFRYGVYSEQYARELAGDVVGVFIARSGAWMPPWHDQAFVDFVNEGAGMMGLMAETCEEQEKQDPMKPRPFDLQGALAAEKVSQEMLKAWHEQRKASGGK
jgi:hypothetical protein